eukprot:gene10031-10187_t
MLQSQRQLCLEESELEDIGRLLLSYALKDAEGVTVCEQDGPRINYDGFSLAAQEIKQDLGPAVAPYFQPSTFLKFERDAVGAISLPVLMQYISLSTVSLRLRAQLAEYDDRGSGELDVPQLQRYLTAVAATAPLLAGMEPSFLPHYLQIASRKLLFFHGRHSVNCRKQEVKHGHNAEGSSSSAGLVVKLADLVSSSVMAELQELLLLGANAEQDRDMFSNWFTLQSTQRVLSTYTNWDVDGNGTLSKDEFSAISQGYLTLSDLYTFFREVKGMWVAMGEYKDLDIYDVLDEIMDMVKPAQPGRITKGDLEACKMSGIVFGMLANVEQFYQYNYRENFMHQDGEPEAGA